MSTPDRPLTTKQDRERARRERRRRSTLISSISTVIVLGGIVALVVTSPGWPTVRDTFFSWTWFRRSIGPVASGFWLDVKLFLIVEAFKIHRVNAIVVDLATAFELTSTELHDTTIAGQFSAPGGDQWGLLMAKGSPIAGCVGRAVTQLKSDGTLAQLDKRWIASSAKVPVLH